jgi:cytochrome b6-f complex iron-sulfur subunit
MNRRSFFNKFALLCFSGSLPWALAACSKSLKTQAQNLPSPIFTKASRLDGYIPVGSITNLNATGAIASTGSVTSPVDGLNIIIVKNPADSQTPLAINTKCTHQGCAVEWHGDKNKFICPCHGAEYSSSGSIVRGPASKPLETYPVKVEAGSILIKTT